MNYFVTAIGTDCGKTLISAILCEALKADYWKPIQAGLPRDADTVKNFISSPELKIYNEAYLLKTPASPHASAAIDGITINIKNIQVPRSNRDLVIEGAGGCLVPLNDKDFVIDLIAHLNIPVILVANLYLGSINHTLLTIEALKNRNISVKGIVFNGDSNNESERIILLHSKLKCLANVRKETILDKAVILKYAEILRTKWYE
jgi:dethiobiotin synthetase